jgi:hypothetical protein
MQRKPDREVQDHADDGGGDAGERAVQRLVVAQPLNEGCADAPVPASIDPWAVVLSLAAMIAIFRFKAGMIQTLLACSAAGILLHLVGVIR